MTWKQVDTDWWYGSEGASEGAWVRRSAQLKCNGTCKITGNAGPCLGDPRTKFVGWRNMQPVLFWFDTLEAACRAVEKQAA